MSAVSSNTFNVGDYVYMLNQLEYGIFRLEDNFDEDYTLKAGIYQFKANSLKIVHATEENWKMLTQLTGCYDIQSPADLLDSQLRYHKVLCLVSNISANSDMVYRVISSKVSSEPDLYIDTDGHAWNLVKMISVVK